ncbi:MAG: hypothetical protein AAGA25_09100 [Planctomycetota bacterium]
MQIKQLINDNPAVIVVVSIVLLLLAGLRFTMALGGSTLSEDKWMFDLNAGALVLASRGTVAPVEIDTGVFQYPGMGPAGSVVDVALYSCEGSVKLAPGMTVSELDAKGVRVGFLSRYPDEVLSVLMSEQGNAMTEAPVLISDVSGQKWVGQESRPGAEIMDKVGGMCGGDLPKMLRR